MQKEENAALKEERRSNDNKYEKKATEEDVTENTRITEEPITPKGKRYSVLKRDTERKGKVEIFTRSGLKSKVSEKDISTSSSEARNISMESTSRELPCESSENLSPRESRIEKKKAESSTDETRDHDTNGTLERNTNEGSSDKAQTKSKEKDNESVEPTKCRNDPRLERKIRNKVIIIRSIF